MSNIDCDYETEITAAVQMAETATSNFERFDWLFLALAWQALSRCHNENIQQAAPAPVEAIATRPTGDAHGGGSGADC